MLVCTEYADRRRKEITMDNDDEMIGRILSRREVLKLVGATSMAVLVSCGPSTASTDSSSAVMEVTSTVTSAPTLNAEAQTAVAIENNPAAFASQEAEVATAEAVNATIESVNATAVPACVVRPEVTEGPYYVNEDLVRSDIRTDPATGAAREGTPLALAFAVSQVSSSGCVPLRGATVEIWHCDASGQYSGVSDRGSSTQGELWLRGEQVTDASGVATFTTIYPGWYPGRAVHIHFKVRPNENSEFTSQLFFDEAVTVEAFAVAPYADKGAPDTPNSTDNIYDELLLVNTSRTSDGYAATFPIGIDLSTL
jgi:protocatechuate 3,4-dioxygenase beta subunit